MKTIKDISLKGKRVFIRVDFNVPMDETQHITDDIRIREGLSTIKYAIENKAKVIVSSHMGRPKGRVVPELSLKPVAHRLAGLMDRDVKMAPDCVGNDVENLVSNMIEGDVLMLENLRFYSEEEKNDIAFAEQLGKLCDVYVNNAFAVSHRKHASVDAITRSVPVSCAGFLLQKELSFFNKAMNEPSRPLVAIVGGAKVSSKLKALENMLLTVDKIIIGGAMANTFLKSKGFDLGGSKIEEDLVDAADAIIKSADEKGVKFYLPVDFVAAERFDQNSAVRIVPAQEIPPEWMALDIGPATSLLYASAIYDAKTIVWNGPMGVFEMDAFSRGTMSMVQSVVNSHALTIVGGGDTDLAVHKSGDSDKISYISTGGGAFLHLLEGKELPAVIALKDV